jgi:hypothetical protein
MLKAMGIEDEKIDQIIEAHTETTDALKGERDQYKVDAEKLPDVQRQLDAAKEAVEAVGGDDEYKVKYDEEHEAFEKYKEQVEAEKAATERRSLYRQLLLDAGIDDKRVDAVLKVTDMESITVEEGKIKDAEKLTEDIKSEWSAFITKPDTKGAPVDNPPAADPAPKEPSSLAEAIRNRYDGKE